MGRSEACYVTVDASQGCAAGFTVCNISIGVSGATQASADFVTIWRVTSRAAPAAALSDFANRAAALSGPLAWNGSILSTTGMFVVGFTSNADVTAAGWAVSWRANSGAAKFCFGRTETASSGCIEDASGNLDYGNG